MTRVWYCVNCGYEVTSRGRCHSCRDKLTPSAMEELRAGPGENEVGYRIEGWTDRDRGLLIVRLNDMGIRHRFEEDELVVESGDEDRVDDLVATLGAVAEESLRDPDEDEDEGDDLAAVDPADDDVEADSDGEDPDDELPDDDLTATLRLLADAATRLRLDPTDMQADADVAEASASVFMVDRHPPFDEEAWSAIGRTTRRLLSSLGADEALEDEIRTAAGVLEKLLSPLAGAGPAATSETDDAERTVYEMDEWLPDQRAQLGFLMEQAGIDYTWNGIELLVPSSREDEVEALFDQIVGRSGDDEDGDERRYQAVAELFAACGRLAGDPTDPIRRDNVARWVKESEGPPLLGMDEVDWFRIRTRARNLGALIDDDGDADDIFSEANQLHDLLRSVV